MKELLKQFFYLLDTEAKRKIAFLLLYFLFSSVLDIVGIGLIGVFLITLSNKPFLIFKNQLWIHNYLLYFSQQTLVTIVGILILAALLFKSIAALIIQRKVIHFSQSYGFRLNIRMMKAYQYAPYSYHLQINSVTAFTRINQANAFVHFILSPSIMLISNLIVGSVILISLMMATPIPSFILLTLFLLLGITQDMVVKKRLTNAGTEMSLIDSERNKAIDHGLKGLKEIRILGKENYFLSRYIFYSKRALHAGMIISNWSNAPRYLMENGIALFIIGFCIIGIASGYSMSAIVAIVGMFAVAGIRLLPTISMIIANINAIRANYPTMKLVYDDLLELQSLENISLLREVNDPQNSKLLFSSAISFENISYTYPYAMKATISQVSLHIIKGQSVGIIGPSGAGKTTLINIILGLLIPQTGQVLIDGKPISDLRSWHNQCAYIPQSIFLLDDSLKRNIAMGIEDKEIDEKKLWNVIEMAQLKNLVAQLPQGVDSHIGEKGIRLSGGEQQRVALARTLYFDRDVIVMDEATSSLDNETEKELINAIKILKGRKTLIVIAHRLSTVEYCDVLYRLENGRITAVGSYHEVVCI